MTLFVPCNSRLCRGALLLAVVFATVACPAPAQAPPPPPPGLAQMPTKLDPTIIIPQFDVISVKPAKDNQTQMRFTPDGLHGTGVTVRFLLLEGYGGISRERFIGEPAWAGTEGFDIEAKVAPSDVGTLARMAFAQRRTMFQSILAERFKLAVHHETRELPVYVLTVAKGGPKLKPSAPDEGSTLQPDNGTPQAESAPSVFTALQEQLGLKLESSKAPVDVIVIDHIEKSTEN